MTSQLVTIFGGSGFIGRYIVKRLAKKGWVIRVAVRRPARAAFLKPLGDVGQITPVRAKIQDAEAVRAAVSGAEAVINLTGILAEHGDQRFDAVHARGAGLVARECAELGVRNLVQMSALGADPESASLYARSKAAGEAAVREAFPQAVVVRPSIVFGPEDDFFNRFGELATFLPVLPLIDGGHTRFQPVYVGDVADAIVKALTDPACAGKTYELGGPRVYTFKELLELLLREIRRKRLLINLPSGIARIQATFLELLPKPPLTRDQIKLLAQDNVVSEGALTLKDLGIEPTSVEVIVPTYLDRFRPGGRFNREAEA